MNRIGSYLIYSCALIGASVLGAIVQSRWTGEEVTLTQINIASSFVIVAVVQFALPWVIERLRTQENRG